MIQTVDLPSIYQQKTDMIWDFHHHKKKKKRLYIAAK